MMLWWIEDDGPSGITCFTTVEAGEDAQEALDWYCAGPLPPGAHRIRLWREREAALARTTPDAEGLRSIPRRSRLVNP